MIFVLEVTNAERTVSEARKQMIRVRHKVVKTKRNGSTLVKFKIPVADVARFAEMYGISEEDLMATRPN